MTVWDRRVRRLWNNFNDKLMAWRITDSLVRAELDNREEGRVKGLIQLVGRDDAVTLDLEGNFLRDIAGCLLTLENPNPLESESTDLIQAQTGQTGEMTASKKIRVLDVTVEEALRRKSSGEPVPDHWSNGVYLEWFSEANGRVVIESERYRVSISAPEWVMSQEAAEAQQRNSDERKEDWATGLQQQIEAIGFGPSEAEAEIVQYLEEHEQSGSDSIFEMDEDDEPMDEFEWEKELRRCDERTDHYMELLETYRNDPNADEKIAQEMGWSGLPTREEFDAGLTDMQPEDILGPEEEPLPEDEGKTWIRTEDGRVVHPLYHKAHAVAMNLWTMCDDAGFLSETGDENVQQMVDQAMLFTTKLAGALNSLYLDPDYDRGFVIALLKRAMPVFNGCMDAMEDVEGESLIPTQLLTPFRDRLYAVRQEILLLMDQMRSG